MPLVPIPQSEADILETKSLPDEQAEMADLLGFFCLAGNSAQLRQNNGYCFLWAADCWITRIDLLFTQPASAGSPRQSNISHYLA
jgi:hypothetical protein